MDKEECCVRSAGMGQTGIKIIDGEFGIASCKAEEIPQWVTKLGRAKDVIYFYFHQRDLIVLNEDNVNYEFNLAIAKEYLDFSDKGKRMFMQQVKNVRIETYKFLRCLNYVTRIRKKLYKSVKRKEGALNAAS